MPGTEIDTIDTIILLSIIFISFPEIIIIEKVAYEKRSKLCLQKYKNNSGEPWQDWLNCNLNHE